MQVGEEQLGSTDQELVKQCLTGNEEAFAEIVGRYKRLIYSVVYNMIGDREQSYDISQEAFVRIYKALDRYNPEYKFSTWAVKIATNLCLDILRKKKPDLVPIEEVENVSNCFETPETMYMKKERNEKIKKAIAELPDKYRIPIILFHQGGLSYEEMTKVLGQPVSIVKNRLYRARLMLKNRLMGEYKEGLL